MPSYGAELREARASVRLDWTGFHAMPFLGGFRVGRAKRPLSSRLHGSLDVALEDMGFEDITYLNQRNAQPVVPLDQKEGF